MLPKILASYSLTLSLLATSFNTTAEEYYWHIQPEAWDWQGPQKNHLYPEQACRFLHENTEYEMYEYGSATPTSRENQWTCNLFYGDGPDDNLAISIYRHGNSCEGGKAFNNFTEQCEAQGVDNSCPSSLTTWRNLYAPDYVSAEASAYMMTCSVTYTRYGDGFCGCGVTRGYPSSGFGINASAGFLLSPLTPSKLQLNNYLTGYGASTSYYYGFGGAFAGNEIGRAHV